MVYLFKLLKAKKAKYYRLFAWPFNTGHNTRVAPFYGSRYSPLKKENDPVPVAEPKGSEFDFAKFIPPENFIEEEYRSNIKSEDLHSYLNGGAPDQFKSIKHKEMIQNLAQLVTSGRLSNHPLLKKDLKYLESKSKSYGNCLFEDDAELKSLIKVMKHLQKECHEVKLIKDKTQKVDNVKIKQRRREPTKKDQIKADVIVKQQIDDKSSQQPSEKQISSDNDVDTYQNLDGVERPVDFSNNNNNKVQKGAISLNNTGDYFSDETAQHFPFVEKTVKVLPKSRSIETIREKLNFEYGNVLHKYPKNHISRFGKINEKHFMAVAALLENRLLGKSSEGTNVLIRVFLNGNDKDSLKLRKMKTDMMKACLEVYFFPSKNSIQISQMHSYVERITSDIFETKDKLTDIFGRKFRHEGCNQDAIMFVSQSVVALLKHKDLCLLETLPVILGLQKSRLLILNMTDKPPLL